MKTEQLKESIQAAQAHPQHGRVTRGVVKAFGEEEVTKLVEAMQSPSFNWRKLRDTLTEAETSGILKEAIAESAFQSLLRLGVETIIRSGYEVPKTIWQDVLLEQGSNSLYQPYGWTFRPGLPKEVPNGSEFDDTQVVPFDIIVKNRKFGRRLSFERELFEDDQTGEVQRKSSELGENMQVLKEIWFAGILSGAAFSYGSTNVPAPTYNDPDPDGATSVYVAPATNARRANRPAAFTALTQPAFQAARTALLTMKDSLGNIIAVNPNALVVSPRDEYVAATLMNASWWPTVSEAAPATAARATDFNPIQGMANVKVCRWLTDKAWYLGQSKSRSVVFQRRTGLEVVQEDPNSGDSFKRDLFIYRVRERWMMFWADARFWYQGNDGTV